MLQRGFPTITDKVILGELSNLLPQMPQVWSGEGPSVLRVPAQQPWAPFVTASLSLMKVRMGHNRYIAGLASTYVILIQTSLNKGLIDNAIHHWFRQWLGDKPLSEPMMV